MTNSLNKQIINYSVYQLLCWSFFMIIVSVSTFFHFLLDHRLGIIEDWLFEFGWQLIILAKTLGFFILYSFYKIKFDVGSPLEAIALEGNKKINHNLIKSILFLIVSISIFGQYQLNTSVNFSKVLASFISVTLFFSLDIVFILLLQRLWKIEVKQQLIAILSLSSVFVLFSNIFYFRDSLQSFIFLSHIFLVSILVFYKSESWSNPLLYVILILAPLSSILGIDPIWGNKFSLLKSSFGNGDIYLYIIFVINLIFLSVLKNNKSLKLGGLKSGTSTN